MKRIESSTTTEDKTSRESSSTDASPHNHYRIGYITDLLMEIHHEYKATNNQVKKTIIHSFINSFSRDELDEMCRGFMGDMATLKKIADSGGIGSDKLSSSSSTPNNTTDPPQIKRMKN